MGREVSVVSSNISGAMAFSADSPDGKSRILMEKIWIAGVTEEAKISVSKPTDLEERLQRVEVLRKRGMNFYRALGKR